MHSQRRNIHSDELEAYFFEHEAQRRKETIDDPDALDKFKQKWKTNKMQLTSGFNTLQVPLGYQLHSHIMAMAYGRAGSPAPLVFHSGPSLLLLKF